MRDVGPLEIALIVVAIVLVFGVGKLGQLGGALGKSIREFRHERDRKDDLPDAGTVESKDEKAAAQLPSNTTGTKYCRRCGGSMSANARFCMGCGAKLENYDSRPS